LHVVGHGGSDADEDEKGEDDLAEDTPGEAQLWRCSAPASASPSLFCYNCAYELCVKERKQTSIVKAHDGYQSWRFIRGHVSATYILGTTDNVHFVKHTQVY